MEADQRYPTPHHETWTPLIETGLWCRNEPTWRGQVRSAPVIGRHARDHYTKWPSRKDAVLAAYCADRPCRVELLGGVSRATRIIGRTPANWLVHPFNSLSAQEFLEGLDFFVHYPHEEYIEEFGRAVLEAMAVGLPVVLPPVFKETFGDAALYAEPADVWNVIEAVWRDEQIYLSRARASRDFVLQTGDWKHFEERLRSLQ
jgi:glycosyltransferase involved in cell wall biosynthesis